MFKPPVPKIPVKPAAAPAKPVAPPATRAMVPAAKPAAGALMAYIAPDKDALRKERAQIAKERAEAHKSGDNYKLEAGKNVIRILPGRNTGHPFRVGYVHYLKNPAKPDGYSRPVMCPLKNNKMPCLVCAYEQELKAEGTQVSKAAASDFRSSRRIFCNVINIQDMTKGVQVLSMGVRLYEDLLSLLCGDENRPEEFPGVDFVHPTQGYNLMIEKEVGDAKNPKDTTTYGKPQPSAKPTAIPIADWAAKLHDLSKVVEDITDDKIRAILEGRPEAEDGGDSAAPPADIGNVGDVSDNMYE